MEAVSFQHYLETQRLIAYDQAQGKLPEGIFLTREDYLLGIFDMVGELMRFAITSMATSGEIPGGLVGDSAGSDGMEIDSGQSGGDAASHKHIGFDLRALRAHLEALDMKSSTIRTDVDKKMEVMKTCVDKVENAMYGLIVRGKERPKGWVPGVREDGPEAVESY